MRPAVKAQSTLSMLEDYLISTSINVSLFISSTVSEICKFHYVLINRVLLTGVPGALVKHTIKGNYYHKRKLFLTLL